MPETPLIVTIDAEGDDLWAKPREITTRNAAYLPRFQALCERYGLKPVYLTNYEMAVSDEFAEFARDVLERDAGEIGMHLHAWNSPPLFSLTDDDFRHQPYLIEYPEPVMREKIRCMTRLLEARFGRCITSHRAGRWAFDRRYASMLIDEGYRVDCSITPGVDWRPHAGDPGGDGGSDYRASPAQPHFLAGGALLEVPMTTRASRLYRRAPWAYRVPLLRRAANRVSRGLGWLCPAESDLGTMLDVANQARAEGAAHLQFMLHSSELMPGGSPSFRDASDIERLYERLEMLFGQLRGWCRGMTLQEFRAQAA